MDGGGILKECRDVVAKGGTAKGQNGCNRPTLAVKLKHIE